MNKINTLERRKLLVVDDKQVNRDLLVKILQPIGFEIETAKNGHEALSMASAVQPDLILLDLFMPGKTGFTAGKELHEIPELKNIPIVIVSASYITEKVKKYLKCTDYLTKPVDENKLLELLQKYLHLEWTYKKYLKAATL